MSESREYYSRSEQYGDVYISQEVLEMIAGAAAVEVEGVTGLAGGSVSDQLLGRKKLSKGINVLWESDNITIDISIQIKYGSIIPEVARKVQEAIIANVEATSGMKVTAVNVRVGGVTFEQTEE
ncbi:MAG: Asp23/Gls24 family envelope stress response protein [Clostridiales bacterium]|uniref:Asp23/Gls24 family envelope stress response protein n=1 Tax=Evtepia sp. TaxID=2773933 RepID=UPI0029875D15|nr:Asp23/Gls24 family envelope stress response protein [Evtepia sp.]MDD7289306.1 Asp23/Gls24 family envelope stress response protein [Clostridiales bacterium]MDY3993996.1 Asp23/Gls24 family envelope stress response protein [Evtepia sp.]MDY4430695.1 Asp23/Gls24 family envelope stress response protein [Evtepia sp.]